MKSQKEVRKNIAERLKTARIKAGYASAKDFCDKYQFSLLDYQQHEEAEHAMHASTIMQYCKVLNISIAYLILGEEEKDLKKTTH